MLVIHAEDNGSATKTVVATIDCDGKRRGSLALACDGEIVVKTNKCDAWAHEIAAEMARERGWKRRIVDDGNQGDVWLCPACQAVLS